MKTYQKILIELGIIAIAICVTIFAIVPLVQKGTEMATRYKYANRHEACNSVYYWRTTLKLSDEERAFVRDHDIKRIYLRLFDVEMSGYQDAVPVATLLFQDSLPGNIEYVPTVYITQAAIRNISGNEKEIAGKIVKRVLNIVDYHYIPNVKEMQIDGDWQESTRDGYFKLCEEMRKLLHEQDIALSATIRLSQLREPTPPVDYGTLMLYNTNSVRDANTDNSILSIATCRQYMKGDAVGRYDLRLDYAIPAFEWSVAHSEDGYFRHLSGTTDFGNAQFEEVDSTHYRAKWSDVYHGQYYQQNDQIRIESTPIELLRELKENIAISAKQSITLYHLDAKQLNRYTYEDIEEIFAR